MGYMSVLVGLLFVFLIHQKIQAALSPSPRIHNGWPVGLYLASNAAALVYYLRRMNAAARDLAPGSAGVR